MEPAKRGNPWLETTDGQIWELKGNCAIGRHPESDVVIESDRTSREHAVILVQNGFRVTLMDRPSLNGTFLNDQQIFYPVTLTDGDKITIGGVDLKFRQPNAVKGSAASDAGGQATVLEMRQYKTWLLIADIVKFTEMIRTHPPEVLQTVVGGWFRESSALLENRGSRISKYLGDGFLGYWRDSPGAGAIVAATLRDFHDLRRKNRLKFRIAVHFGSVNFGGMSFVGEESMFGEDQNFTFRLEALAGKLGLPYCVSEPAKQLLEGHVPLRFAGEHEVEGFDGLHRCYEIVFPD